MWRDSNRIISRQDAQRIIATVIEIGVVIAMETHVYSFNGIYYIQARGGPIGLCVTAALASLIMCYFDRALAHLLTRESIKKNLSFRYVDDSRYGMKPVKAGVRWDGCKVVFLKKKKKRETNE